MGANDRAIAPSSLLALIPDERPGAATNQVLRSLVLTVAGKADATATPSLEENDPPIIFPNAAIAASITIPLGIQNIPKRIGGISFGFSSSVATDAANYWTASLQVRRDGLLPVQMASQTTQTGSGATAGLAITAFKPWTFDTASNWLETIRSIRKGDYLQVVFTKTGTPGPLNDGSASIRYEPNAPTLQGRDSFSRIDSLISAGSLESLQAWSVMSQPVANTASVWGIKTGQLAIQVHSNQGRDYIVFDAGSPNVEISAILRNPAAAGICCRMVAGSAASPRSGFTGNATTFFREDAGVLTAVIAATDTFIADDTITVVSSGDSHLLYRNGVKIGGAFDSAYMTSTLFGFRNTSGALNTGLFDDLRVAVM